ncbi:hypothetical protein AOQ84DRAFT_385338 [Glonium stellatum]|uniref:Organic solute transporter Ostalpha-domain-containing protein n=1 Tax=Glonium stellatum TaxID=574774 RepID=A0A8E2JY72_9PEZI|nr:hypothetical protein AOQ84DRAFT_385338 [Glonium stellatum]
MDHIRILSRSLFHHSSSSSNHTCPSVTESSPTIVPLVGSMTYHTLTAIIAAICLIITTVLAAISLIRHATHYSSPTQQRQILRIICLMPWVALITFLSVLSESVGPYIAPAVDFGVALAISAFLLLLCDFVLAGPDGFDDLFGEGATARGQFNMHSPPWLKRVWYLVLQFIPVSIILWIATAASMAAGTYCATSNKPYFAHIWITVLQGFLEGAALFSVLRFYNIMILKLTPYGVMMKLIAFKGIVFLSFLQNIILGLLVSFHVIKPSKYMTYHDISIGLPNLVLACETPIFAAFIMVAYSTKPYTSLKVGRAYQGGPGGIKAILAALNYSDILSSFVRGPMRLVREQHQLVKPADSIGLMTPSSYESGPPNASQGYSNPPTYQPVQQPYDNGQNIPINPEAWEREHV